MTSDYGAFFGRAQCYVDGAWSTPSGDPATVVIDPFSEQPIGEVAEAGGPLVEVYSADRDHAERFARRLDCGQVKINGCAPGTIRTCPSAAPSSPATGASLAL